MSTNYYHRTEICECCGRYTSRHIGKSSAGWEFGFHAIEEDNLTIKSWKEWLFALNSGKIFDEYGEEISLNEFIMVVQNRNNGKKLLNHTTWCNSQGYNEGVFLDDEGYSFTSGEFC